MLENTHAEELHKHLFYIADQINHGKYLISTIEEARQLAGLNLKAGIKARDAAAFSAAVNYLQQGIDLLNADAWKSDYDLAFSLYIQQMECRYIIRDFDEAERLFSVITANAASNKDKAKACTTMIVLYTNKRSFPKALELGEKALKLYDVKISTGYRPAAGSHRVDQG
jgi:predicted ATPase